MKSKTNPTSSKVVRSRNNVLLDKWSLVHITSGVLLGWLLPPILALVLLVLWEPLEILVLSPLLHKVGINFGYETLKNSLSDIVYDVIGFLIGYYIITKLVTLVFN